MKLVHPSVERVRRPPSSWLTDLLTALVLGIVLGLVLAILHLIRPTPVVPADWHEEVVSGLMNEVDR